MLNSRGFGEYVLEEQLSLNQYDLEGFSLIRLKQLQFS
jgi:hypothetical protein